MSLFDVLKYPISDPPISQEIRNLPCNLALTWLKICDWKIPNWKGNYEKLIDDAAYHYSNRYRSDLNMHRNDLAILRKLIIEYEPI